MSRFRSGSLVVWSRSAADLTSSFFFLSYLCMLRYASLWQSTNPSLRYPDESHRNPGYRDSHRVHRYQSNLHDEAIKKIIAHEVINSYWILGYMCAWVESSTRQYVQLHNSDPGLRAYQSLSPRFCHSAISITGYILECIINFWKFNRNVFYIKKNIISHSTLRLELIYRCIKRNGSQLIQPGKS